MDVLRLEVFPLLGIEIVKKAIKIYVLKWKNECFEEAAMLEDKFIGGSWKVLGLIVIR